MYKIANYKVSCKSPLIALDNVLYLLKVENIPCRVYANFIVFEKEFTYTIFKNGKKPENHINITKLKCRSDIEKALSVLSDLLKFHNLHNFKIDNITASTSSYTTTDLNQISQKKTWGVLKYNPEKFPGLFIKHALGTVIIFHSGKVVILGCKEENNVEWLVHQAIALIKTG